MLKRSLELWSLAWQMFYPYVMISATQARESDDLRHAMSPFLSFLLLFLARKESWDM